MPLQTWSEKVRQNDFSLPWAIQIGKDANFEPTDIAQLKVSVNGVEITTAEVTATTEDINTLFPGNPDSPSGAGQVIRGIHTFEKPATSDNASQYNLSSLYGVRFTNTGTCDLTVFNLLRSFHKLYPNEAFDSADVSGLGMTPTNETDYVETYNKVSTVGTPENLVYEAAVAAISNVPYPAELVSLFNSLSGESTAEEIAAVVNSSEFQTYYGSTILVPNLPFELVLLDSTKTQKTALPLVLAPGDSFVLSLTKDLSNYLYHPFVTL